MLPVFILFPTHNNYYSSIQKNFSELYFNYFSTLTDSSELMISGGFFLLTVIEKVNFFKKKIKITIIIAMLMSLFAPILYPIFIQLMLKPIVENNELDYCLKVLISFNMLFLLVNGICFEICMFSFSLNPKNKLCKIKKNIISGREIMIIILAILLPILGNNNRVIAIIIELAYCAFPLATLCMLFLYLDVLVHSFVFYDPFTRKIHMLATCIEGSFLVSCIFANIFEETLF